MPVCSDTFRISYKFIKVQNAGNYKPFRGSGIGWVFSKLAFDLFATSPRRVVGHYSDDRSLQWWSINSNTCAASAWTRPPGVFSMQGNFWGDSSFVLLLWQNKTLLERTVTTYPWKTQAQEDVEMINPWLYMGNEQSPWDAINSVMPMLCPNNTPRP